MYPLGPNWHSVSYLASLWGKDLSTVQKWCSNGFLIECGFKVIQLGSGYIPGSRGRGNRRWLIYVPPDPSSALTLASADTILDLHPAA